MLRLDTADAVGVAIMSVHWREMQNGLTWSKLGQYRFLKNGMVL